jgi:hypothetical protein
VVARTFITGLVWDRGTRTRLSEENEIGKLRKKETQTTGAVVVIGSVTLGVYKGQQNNGSIVLVLAAVQWHRVELAFPP